MSRATVPAGVNAQLTTGNGHRDCRANRSLLCPTCSSGFLRFESDHTGQTFEQCDVCDYRSRFRSEGHQERVPRLPTTKPKGRRPRNG